MIGAGPAGAVAALTLARQGADVLLVDRSDGLAFRVGESLPSAVLPVLERLALLECILKGDHLPCYGNRSAWGSRELHSSDSIVSPYGHGWHLDRRQFDSSLVRSAEEAGVRLLRSTRVVGASRTGGGWLIQFRRGAHVGTTQVNFILDCSGRQAAFARIKGARRVADDRLIGVVALLEPTAAANDDDSTTLVEAVASGWWYTARLPHGLRIAVYHSDGDLIDVVRARSVDGWQVLVNGTEHVRRLCEEHRYKLWNAPWITLANSSRLISPVGDGWIAAGDAAVAFDPLSSQGILVALVLGYRAAMDVIDTGCREGITTNRYAAIVRALYQHYLRERWHYYAREERWPEARFWRRRRSDAPAAHDVSPRSLHAAATPVAPSTTPDAVYW